MRVLSNAIMVLGLLTLATAVFAQSATTTPATAVNPAPAAPVATSKRFACQTASQGFQGQEQRDQMQLCMAQARLDCLKQAIDQKIVGPQRKEFLKSCAGAIAE
jgi:Spy/CpxP family protein refolding chaperone